MKVNKLITVEGRVQHVGFRYSAMDAARKYEIKGWVANRPEGNVVIEAEGEEDNIYRFIAWCRQGPSLAKVVHVNIQDGVLSHYSDFSIR
jgi:acylphosphatase